VAALRVVTWNIRAAIGPGPFPGSWWRRVDPQRLSAIGTVIRSLEADLVALQEVAVLSFDGALVNNTADLATATGYEARFAATRHFTMDEADGRPSGAGLFGNALLSRLPLGSVRAVALPMAPSDALVEPRGVDHPLAGLRYADAPPTIREPRCLLLAEARLPDAGSVRIGVTHLAHVGSGERRLQAAACAAAMAEGEPAASVLAGDLNAAMEADELAPLRDGWTDAFGAVGVPIGDHRRETTDDGAAIDHVLVRGLRVVSCRRVDEAGWLSDHLPLVADLDV
jgi:endonuclease/exonuclease/phosphatase family metal-dependent hydrolase